MLDRKLNVRADAGGAVGAARVAFDTHVDGCQDCQPHLCHVAETLWRNTCLAALRGEHALKQSNELAEGIFADGFD